MTDGTRILDRYPASACLHALFDEAADALFLVDADTLAIVEANPLACRLTGQTRQELITLPITAILESEEGAEDWQRAVKRTTSFHGKPGFLLKTTAPGGPISVGLSVSRLHVPSASLTLFVLRDMRQTNSLVRKLRRTEQELREVLLSLSDGIWAATLAGNAWHYLYVSPVVAQLTGVALTTLLDNPSALVPRVHPEDRERYLAYRRRLLQGEPGEITFRLIRHTTAELLWFRERVKAANTPAGFRLFGVLADITEQQRIQEEREAAERRLQETQRLQALGALASGVAHDFNNLLTAVLGYSSLLHEQLSPEHPGRQFTQGIQDAATRGAVLTAQMVAYAGTGLIQKRSIALATIVREVVESQRNRLLTGATIALDIAPDLPTIHADSALMQQILTQLLTNAAEALTGAGETIAVRLSRAEITDSVIADVSPGRLHRDRDYLELQVRDTGAGMTPEVRARMFEPFFSTKFLGRGLGLAAVHGIVRSHEGAIAVQSEPGQGTTFRVYFPIPPVPGTPPVA